MIKTITCPFCSYHLEIEVEFAKKNGRVFCGTCCKSFEIQVTEQEVPAETITKEESLKELEKELDAAVEEFTVDEDQYPWWWV